MSEHRYTGSFFLSLLLHGLLVGIFAAFVLLQHDKKPEIVKVFDVVAGPGDDLSATEAPTGPSVDNSRIDLQLPPPPPEMPPLPPEPAPVIEEESPPIEPVPTPAPLPTPVPVPEKPAPTPPKPAPIKRPTPPAPAPSPKPDKPKPPKPASQNAPISKEEFDRRFGSQKNASQKNSPAPHNPTPPKLIDPGAVSEGLRNGSKGGGGDALSTAAMASQMEAYLSRLIFLLKKNHQKPPGLSDQLWLEVSYFLAANGKVSQVKITRPSGDAAFDHSVLAAFATLPPLGNRPDGQSSTRTIIFRVKDL